MNNNCIYYEYQNKWKNIHIMTKHHIQYVTKAGNLKLDNGILLDKNLTPIGKHKNDSTLVTQIFYHDTQEAAARFETIGHQNNIKHIITHIQEHFDHYTDTQYAAIATQLAAIDITVKKEERT